MPERGKYIVLEGGEFSGKSTQLRLLKDAFERREIDAVFTREPGSATPVGSEIRRLLLDPTITINRVETEIALFTADRAENWAQIIDPALEEGKVVVSDRNWYSTLAYQTAQRPELEPKIRTVTEALLHPHYVRPDLALILSLSEDERYRRGTIRDKEFATDDSFESRGREYFERVKQVYDRLPRLVGAIAIDAGAEPPIVFQRIWKQVGQTLRTESKI